MLVFWEDLVSPILEMLGVKNVVEIGSQKGQNTRNIATYCQKVDGMLYSIDPFPVFDVSKMNKDYHGNIEVIQELSLSALPKIYDYDAILIDGDHNWYTVFNELKIIAKNFKNKHKFPVIFLHDIGWPYGRRDLYYNPENIPLGYRQPYKKMGLSLETSNLIPDGFNSHLYNAIYENNPNNGVLTAVEDFLDITKQDLELISFYGFNGLGIIVPKNKAEEIRSFVNSKKDILIAKLETDRIKDIVDKQALSQQLSITKNLLNKIQKEYEAKESELVRLTLEKETLNESLQVHKQKITELSEQINFSKQSKLKYEQQIRDLTKQISLLEQRLKNVQETLGEEKKLRQLNKDDNNSHKEKFNQIQDELQAVKKKLDKTERRLIQAEGAAYTHRNSIRYRLGDIIILALRPSKDTLLFPMRLFKLLAEGLRKKKSKNYGNVNSINVTEDSKDGKNKIIDLHKKHLNNTPLEQYPFVSIIILNRNGLNHLKRLFKSLRDNTNYPNYEVIIVDNASNDGSIEYFEKNEYSLPLRIIKNTSNVTFSKGNNQGAKIAKGEYLVLMNNDVEPLYGWLNELVRCSLRNDNIGSVGAKLIYPFEKNNKNSYKLQHIGIAFKQEQNFIRPYNIGHGEEPFNQRANEIAERSGLTAATLLIKRELYFQVGGLDERYNYGYEDVDLSLKLIFKGYKNIYCPTSVLFHHEFGTQELDKKKDIRERRKNNMDVLREKWYLYLRKRLLLDKLHSLKIFSEKPLKVALAVTEYGPNTTAGDYFTALELGEAMKELGWETTFLARKGKKSWYEVDSDVNVLITLLDSYDLSKIKTNSPYLIKIAWMRNWFERWVEQPYFGLYDIVFASSQLACEYVKRHSGKEVILLPIATNPKRFSSKSQIETNLKPSYSCDYCFTGSYWNDSREIINFLDPSILTQYKFNLYGKNWERVDKLKQYHKGFINYDQIPQVYANTKIVLDDANRVTKPFGSVNSRVFDALASGCLVLTNGIRGSEDTFEGKLPTFSSKEELNHILDYYLSNESVRLNKTKELQHMVLSNHTYQNRAQTIKKVLLEQVTKYRIAIKIAAPKWDTVHEWGDYHLALGLKKQFEARGHHTIIQTLYEWDNNDDAFCDIVIVLRGLNEYKVKSNHINIMWNISHPDKVSLDEYNKYDYVFISSDIWAEEVAFKVDVPVKSMHQCTDPIIFKRPENKECKHQLLFVGNSRKVFRKIIKDLLPTDKDLAIYGANWENIVDCKYIKGNHIPNTEVYKYYGACDILLNDHWDDMREKGFISNRIFDGLAAESFIISDKVKGLERIFGDAVITYNSSEELKQLVDYYLTKPEIREGKAKKGAQIVRKEHTYASRVESFLKVIDDLVGQRSK